MDNRIRNFFISLIPSVLIFAIQILIMIFGFEVTIVVKTGEFTTGTFTDWMNSIMSVITTADFNAWVSALYAVSASVIFGLWYRAMRRQGVKDFSLTPAVAAEHIKEAGVEAKDSFSGYKMGIIPGLILFVAGAQYVCNFLVDFLGKAVPEWLAIYEQLMEAAGITEDTITPLMLIYAMILGPVTEELAFRGITYGYARRAMPLWAANGVQAVLFAGMHLNPLQSAYTLLFGLLIGYIYARSRNILLTMLIHVAYNALSLVLGELIIIPEQATFYFLVMLISMMATYFGFILILRSLPIAVSVSPDEEWR